MISEFLSMFSKTIDISSYFLICGFLWTCLPLSVRRIRDVGMAWQWIFLSIIPYIGNIFYDDNINQDNSDLDDEIPF